MSWTVTITYQPHPAAPQQPYFSQTIPALPSPNPTPLQLQMQLFPPPPSPSTTGGAAVQQQANQPSTNQLSGQYQTNYITNNNYQTSTSYAANNSPTYTTTKNTTNYAANTTTNNATNTTTTNTSNNASNNTTNNTTTTATNQPAPEPQQIPQAAPIAQSPPSDFKPSFKDLYYPFEERLRTQQRFPLRSKSPPEIKPKKAPKVNVGYILLDGVPEYSKTILGSKFYPLISGCPVNDCRRTNLDFKWKHAGCGGEFEISSEIKVRCNKCSLISNIMNWKFNCIDHMEEFMKPDINKVTWAVSVVIVEISKLGDRNWARKFQTSLLQLQDQYGYDD